MTIDTIRSDFALLDEWEDRYRYLIELGRELPPFPEALRTDANKVRGCVSQVWLASAVKPNGAGAAPVLPAPAATPAARTEEPAAADPFEALRDLPRVVSLHHK